jgi:hypothetical protein
MHLSKSLLDLLHGLSRKSATIFGKGTIPEPSESHIGKGVALVAQTAAFVYIYARIPQIAEMTLSFHATRVPSSRHLYWRELWGVKHTNLCTTSDMESDLKSASRKQELLSDSKVIVHSDTTAVKSGDLGVSFSSTSIESSSPRSRSEDCRSRTTMATDLGLCIARR